MTTKTLLERIDEAQRRVTIWLEKTHNTPSLILVDTEELLEGIGPLLSDLRPLVEARELLRELIDSNNQLASAEMSMTTAKENYSDSSLDVVAYKIAMAEAHEVEGRVRKFLGEKP